MKITVVVPAYNESRRAKIFIKQALKWLSCSEDHTLVIVNDGSSDNTFQLMKELSDRYPKTAVVIDRKINKGKWFTLREGYINARLCFSANLIAFLDSDLAIGFDQLVDWDGKFDILTGNRYLGKSEFDPKRGFLSRGFAFLVRMLAGLPVNDTQAPFKIIRHSWDTEKIMNNMLEDRWVGDIEMLLMAKQRKLKIMEIPVNYKSVDGDFNVVKNTIRMFFGLIRVVSRWR